MNFILAKVRGACRRLLKPVILDVIVREIRIWGPPERLSIAPTAYLANSFLNTVCGCIVVGDHTFTGPNASIITGTHDYGKLKDERMAAVPASGRDIRIGAGVWIGANAVILGPCAIGDHAVIAAGAVVNADVPAFAIVAGVPARVLKTITPSATDARANRLSCLESRGDAPAKSAGANPSPVDLPASCSRLLNA